MTHPCNKIQRRRVSCTRLFDFALTRFIAGQLLLDTWIELHGRVDPFI